MPRLRRAPSSVLPPVITAILLALCSARSAAQLSVLHNPTGFVLQGEFGAAVAGAGDVDGDGVPDFVVGSPGEVSESGRAYVYSGFDGALIHTINGGAAGDRAGQHVAGGRDVNGDGRPDLLVSTRHTFTGHVKLVSGLDGSVIETFTAGMGVNSHGGDVAFIGSTGPAPDAVPDLLFGLPAESTIQVVNGSTHALIWSIDTPSTTGFGFAVDGADYNGDLSTDYLVSADLDGDVFVYSGATGTELFSIDGSAAVGFGYSVAAIADLDGDGVPELAVGAPFELFGEGTIRVYSGADQSILHTFEGTDGIRLGSCVADAGDVDGDGITDIIGSGAIGKKGRALVFSGADGSVLYSLELEGSNDDFARAVAGIGDLTGDGRADFIVGMPEAFTGDEGYALVYGIPVPPGVVEVPVKVVPGRAGRTTLILDGSSDGGDDFIDDPIVVVPKIGFDNVAVDKILVEQDTSHVGFASVGEFETGAQPHMATQADYNADSHPDVITANFGGNSFSYLEHNVDATFGPNVEVPLVNVTGPVVLGSGDFDGDSDTDVVIGGAGGVELFLGDGAGGFVFADFAPVSDVTDLVVGELTGDGDLDVLVATGALALGPGDPEQGTIVVLAGDGSGGLAAGGVASPGIAVASVLLLDVEGDLDLDALLALHAYDAGPLGEPQGEIALYLNNGTGGYTAAPPAQFPGHVVVSAEGTHPLYGAVADLDGDTFPDAVYASGANVAHPAATFGDEQPPITLTVLLADGLGGFTVSEIATPYSGKGVNPELLDVTPDPLDGQVDCILTWYQDTTAGIATSPPTTYVSFIAVLVGDGAGGFGPATPNQFTLGPGLGDGAVAQMDGAGADGGSNGPDIVVPSMPGNSFSVLFGDGNGGFPDPPIAVGNVDDFDPEQFPGQVWEGGPREVHLGDMDSDGDMDVVVYSAWREVSIFGTEHASVSIFLGNGSGGFARVQYLGGMTQLGEAALGDVNLDGDLDVVVTQRGAGLVVVFRGTGDGTTGPMEVHSAPRGYSLSGGLAVGQLPGTSLHHDWVTTAIHDATDEGVLIAYHAKGGGIAQSSVSPMSVSWDEVRSLSGPLTVLSSPPLPTLQELVIGTADGRLVRAVHVGSQQFQPVPLDPAVASAGGGALWLTDYTGDLEADVIACTAATDGAVDQAFVRLLERRGADGFDMSIMPGMSSTSGRRALRPIVCDLDAGPSGSGDQTTDIVLVHGDAGSVTVLMNQLSRYEEYGSGKPGTGGITPHLYGSHYTTPGSYVSIRLEHGLGGAPGLLWVHFLRDEQHPFLHVPLPAVLEVPIGLTGTPGQPGAGSLAILALMPEDPLFVGLEVTHQVLLLDLGAGPPAPFKFSFTNGLAYTIVE